MFVRAQVVVKAEFAAAQVGLRSLAHAGWLTEACQSAYDSGMVGLARVGPFGDVPGASKLVRIYVRDVLVRQDSAVLTLRWEAVGPGEAMFPALDADITLTPDGPGRSRLTLDGAYRPPLAALGAGLDKMVLHRVATPTARALLARIGAAICAVPDGDPELPGPGPMI